jgi:hypothetical protein
MVLALLFLFAAVACGGDDDDGAGSTSGGSGDAPAASDGGSQGGGDTTSGDDEDESDDDPQETNGGGAGAGEVGFGVAGGQRFSVSEVRRCKPFFEGEDNLDLQAVANDGIILFVTQNATSGSLEQEVSIQGGGLGVFSGGAFAPSGGDPWFDSETDAELLGSPFVVIGDRVNAGSPIKLSDPRGSGDTLDVSFDIQIPTEIIDC